jgi:hypothetical protein
LLTVGCPFALLLMRSDQLAVMALKYRNSETFTRMNMAVQAAKERILHAPYANARCSDAGTLAQLTPSLPCVVCALRSEMGLPVYRRDVPGFCSRFADLSVRTFRHVAREPSLMISQSLVSLLVGLGLGGVFWHMNNLLDGTQNRLGVLFFACIFFSLMSMSCLGLLVNERLLYLRHEQSRRADHFFCRPRCRAPPPRTASSCVGTALTCVSVLFCVSAV